MPSKYPQARVASRRRRSLFEQLEDRRLLALSSGPWTLLHGPDADGVDIATEAALDVVELEASLGAAPLEFTAGSPVFISLPDPAGRFVDFAVVESPVMAPELADKYPEIRTYRGQGTEDAAANLRLDISPLGVHAQVLSPSGGFLINPVAGSDSDVYASQHLATISLDDLWLDGGNLPITLGHPIDGVAEDHEHDHDHGPLLAGAAVAAAATGDELRVFRAAFAATGEYTAAFGGTVADGLAAVTTAVNRLNGIYETELAIRFELVANNDQIIYTDPSTDPYSDSNRSALLEENQANLDAVILDQNYDIGHVLGRNTGGGVAVMGAGVTGDKARGASGIPSPSGDQFWVNVLAHELGHQFGGRHTWNGVDDNCVPAQRAAGSAFEPGSGSTILAYPGICGSDNLQILADPFFHSVSYDEITDYVATAIPSVGERISTGNSIPMVDAGSDFTIPARTPFALTAIASDADAGDQLTFSWEQRDLGPAQAVNDGDNGESPLFRAWRPTESPTRYFPRLTDLVNSTTSVGETLPTTNRELNFRAVVRDNRAGGGGVNSDDARIQVVDTGTAFSVTAPNSGVSYPALSFQSVQWDVAGTTANGIDAAHVNILLSTDGGLTYPTVLAAEVPNDGEHEVVLPDLTTDTARVKVEASDNIFFDISDANFSITAAVSNIVAIAGDGLTSVSESGVVDVYDLQLSTPPSGQVVVRVSSDSQVEVSLDGASFSSEIDVAFNDTQPRTVTVRAVDDALVEGRHVGAISHSVISSADLANYPVERAINDTSVRIADNEVADFERLAPLGSLVSVSRANFGTLSSAADTAEFQIAVEPGETIAAVAVPDSSAAILAIELVGVAAPVSSGGSGETLTLPATSVPVGGAVTLRVTSSAPTDFELDVFRNTSLEQNGPAIDGSFVELGSGRSAVVGTSDAVVFDELQFTHTNDPAAFVDISGSANANRLVLGINENTIITTSVGNSAFPAGIVTVGNNGGIAAGAGGFDFIGENSALSSGLFATALFPYWDLFFGPTPGDVYWEERTVGGVATLIVQWQQREHFLTPGGNATFQVQVFETGPTFARFAYQDVDFGLPGVDFGASATIGYQEDANSAVQFGFNRARLADGDVLDLALLRPDSDEYTIDFSGQIGTNVDVVLSGFDGESFADETLELVAPDGSVVATGTQDPVSAGTSVTNYDLGVLGYAIPADGIYTVRVTSELEGAAYAVVVSENLTLDSEPNGSPTDGRRQLSLTTSGLGFLDGSDLNDLYDITLEGGSTVTLQTATPFASTAPTNSLNPELEVVHPDGVTVLAADLDSGEGVNASVTLTAPQSGVYRVRVSATAGTGEYLISATSDEPPLPAVTLAVDRTSLSEGESGTITASLSAATTVPVTVELGFAGTAAPTLDYVVAATQIVVPSGSVVASVPITAVQDSLIEDDETVQVDIAAAINGDASANQPLILTIIDDDGLPPGPSPLPNTESAPASSTINYTFPDDVISGTVSDESFVVHSLHRGQLVGGATSVTVDGRTATHVPTNHFFPGEIVESTLTSEVATTAGAATPEVWRFRTAVPGGTGNLSDSGQTLGDHVSRAVALGDIDADGDLDAFVANYIGGANRVWLNTDGEFVDSGQTLGFNYSTGASLGDFDGDGDLDAFVSNFGGQGNRIWRNDGGRFVDSGQSLGSHNDIGVAVGDLDGDGDLDAFSTGYPSQGNHVWLNDNGIFSDSGQSLGSNDSWKVKLGDLDGDGDLDAFISNIGGNRVWMNNGTAGFQDTGQSLGANVTLGLSLGDVDGDGDLDAFAANLGAGNRVWLNDGGGVFLDSGQSLGDHQAYGMTMGDLDGDGDLDAFVINLNEPDRIWVNDGLGVFGESGQSLGDHGSGDVALGDLDGDGDLDAFVADFGAANRVWLNENGIPRVTLGVDEPSIAEGADTTVSIELRTPTTVPVTVDLQFGGTATPVDDYTVSATQVVIPPGATSGVVTVATVQDTLDEPNEVVEVSILNVVNADASEAVPRNVTILDDDEPRPPLVTLSANPGSIGEAAGAAGFLVTLSVPSTEPVVVDLAFAGTATANTDYVVSATQITIPAGTTTGNVTVTAVQDTVDEPDETIVVEISAVSGGLEDGEQSQVVVIVDDDVPASFMVTDVSVSAASIRIDFNAELDVPDLNLFDTSNANRGLADMTVVGASSGPVLGSLVVNLDRQGLRFIKAGGVLAADTYTLTLRSAADGFEDVGGRLLDGNMDGVEGDDFVTTLVVAEPAANSVILELPDFVRGPGQEVHVPASGSNGIPITFHGGSAVRTAELTVRYDPSKMTISGAVPGPDAPAGATVSVSTDTPGLATVSYASSADSVPGSVQLVTLLADVPTAAASENYGQSHLWEIAGAMLSNASDDRLPAVMDESLQIVAYFADVSGNGRVNASDAAQVARFAALLDTGFAVSLLTDPILLGDVSGNGRINAADASRVASFAALLPVPEIPPIPGGIVIAGLPLLPLRNDREHPLGPAIPVDARTAVGEVGWEVSTAVPGKLVDAAISELVRERRETDVELADLDVTLAELLSDES